MKKIIKNCKRQGIHGYIQNYVHSVCYKTLLILCTDGIIMRSSQGVSFFDLKNGTQSIQERESQVKLFNKSASMQKIPDGNNVAITICYISL